MAVVRMTEPTKRSTRPKVAIVKSAFDLMGWKQFTSDAVYWS
jgi:hypothetical protein